MALCIVCAFVLAVRPDFSWIVARSSVSLYGPWLCISYEPMVTITVDILIILAFKEVELLGM